MSRASGSYSRTRPYIVWVSAIAFAIITLTYFFSNGIPRLRQDEFEWLRPPTSSSSGPSNVDSGAKDEDVMSDTWHFDHQQDSKNYGLSEAQCSSAFPLLYQEIDRAVEYTRQRGRINLQDVETWSRHNGTVRALIRKNELYVVDTQGVWTGDNRLRSLATLNSLNRAISSYDGQLPDIEVPLTVGDMTLEDMDGHPTLWAHSRLQSQEAVFLMPSYSFWSSPSAGLRSYNELRAVLDQSEDYFFDKVPKLVWRGKDPVASESSKALLKESEDQWWGDVVQLLWVDDSRAHEDVLDAEDYCAYVFAVVTEGDDSMARLEHLLNCENVVLAPEFTGIQHFHHLLAPSGPYQNYVRLKRDFSNLRSTMSTLIQRSNMQDKGSLIAENARAMFRDRYLTPAAEACYWRALIRGWASVQDFKPQFWVETEEPDWHAGYGSKTRRRPRGVPFESYTLLEEVEWDLPVEDRHLCISR